jgi:hypothetical protein
MLYELLTFFCINDIGDISWIWGEVVEIKNMVEIWPEIFIVCCK